MSSKAVRDWFRAELQARVDDVPYYDTVNTIEKQKGLPELWLTIEFHDATENRTSLGTRACFREFGNVVIIAVGKSGVGDGPVVDLAERVRNAFFGIHVSVPYGTGSDVGFLMLDAADPPNTESTENGNWFLGSVSCSYTFDTVRGTA